MKVLTAAQMQEIDRIAINDIGIPGVVLMENAGRGVAEEIERRFSALQPRSALVLSGKGNNGGDGYVVARQLLNRGWSVQTLVLAEREAVKGDALINLTVLQRLGGNVAFVPDDSRWDEFEESVTTATIMVDALFGTGLTKPVEGLYRRVINWLNRQSSPVVAVDLPSGVEASTGRILGTAVNASVTVTFALPKVGQVSFPAAGLVGELVTIDIGIPSLVTDQVPSDCVLIDAGCARRLLPLRRPDGNKGTFGHLILLAGATGKSGAAVMAAEAGLRAGTGLVTVACPHSIQSVVATRLVEAITVPLAELNGEVSMPAFDVLMPLIQGKQALALGPGLGLGGEVKELIRRLLQATTLPVVIDADALTALSGKMQLFERQTDRQVVLTPHPGEMSRLTGLSIAEIESDRFDVVRSFASQHQVVVVLKGARSLIAAPDGRVHVNSSGHAGLASGGMGDALTGLIGGLLAQGLDALDAATLGAYLHGSAADRLYRIYGDAGLLASDVIREIPAARQALSKES